MVLPPYNLSGSVTVDGAVQMSFIPALGAGESTHICHGFMYSVQMPWKKPWMLPMWVVYEDCAGVPRGRCIRNC